MTATAGPGISLMSEFTGLAYYAETPAVIFDVQRVGPSTGLPTRTAQGDLLTTAFLSHGDTKHIMLIPSSVEECYTMSQEAFELAEQFQTPIFVMLDLDLGMNNWMSDAFKYPDHADQPRQAASRRRCSRSSASGAATRTSTATASPTGPIPGDGMPAYFARGSGHNAKAQYSERPDDYVENMDRLSRKFETARKFVPKPEVDRDAGAKIGCIGYGTSHWAITESRDQLREETDVKTSYYRLRGVSVHRRSGEVHRRARPNLRDRAEPRRAAVAADEAGPQPGSRRRSCAACCTTTASRSTRARVTDEHAVAGRLRGREENDCCDERPGRPAENNGKTNRIGLETHRLQGQQDDPVRRLRPQLDFRAHHRRVLRDGRRSEPRREAVGHRVLEQEPGVFPRQRRTASTPSTAACRRSAPARCWPTSKLIAIGISGDGDTGAIGIGQFVPPDAAQSADHLHHRRQRLLRPHEGAVLADRRSRLEAQDRRRQRPAADRHLRAGRRARAPRSSRDRSRATRSSCSRCSRRRSRIAAP